MIPLVSLFPCIACISSSCYYLAASYWDDKRRHILLLFLAPFYMFSRKASMSHCIWSLIISSYLEFRHWGGKGLSWWESGALGISRQQKMHSSFLLLRTLAWSSQACLRRNCTVRFDNQPLIARMPDLLRAQ